MNRSFFTRHEINQSFIQLHEWIGLIWLQLPPCAPRYFIRLNSFRLCRLALVPFAVHYFHSFVTSFPLLSFNCFHSFSLRTVNQSIFTSQCQSTRIAFSYHSIQLQSIRVIIAAHYLHVFHYVHYLHFIADNRYIPALITVLL